MALIGQPEPAWKAVAYINGEQKMLSNEDFRGKWHVLYWYPLDFTFVCPTEIKGFQSLAQSKKKGAAAAKEQTAGRALQEAIRALVRGLPATMFTDRDEFDRALDAATRKAGLVPGKPIGNEHELAGALQIADVADEDDRVLHLSGDDPQVVGIESGQPKHVGPGITALRDARYRRRNPEASARASRSRDRDDRRDAAGYRPPRRVRQ